MVKNTPVLLISCSLVLMNCHRAHATDEWHVEATPGVISQEIHFTNGDARLSGTVYLPEHGDHLPAVVALPGSSDPTRGSALFQHLGDNLPLMGIAVLTYDRRGSGKSSGSLENIDYDTLADDAIAGQRALAKLPCIDPHRIGFWGLRQSICPGGAQRR